ncbi:MAG: MaoC family dehydratase N-terminal domain-containing protein, partial [Actinomycetota bacterium]|nr:MaoC family dehydratase N-terminal domain-containing protein [Actinomycetota bacterium]
MSEATALFSRDFDALQAGDRFSSRGRTVTEADVVGFAGLTGDFHPQHTDEEWARERRFGGRVAHGMLVLSYALGLVPFDPERIVALRRISDAVFKRPVALGDTMHVEGRIESAEQVDAEHGLVGSAWRVVNQRGQMVARLRVEVVWRRGEIATPGGAEGSAEEDGRRGEPA